MFDKIVFYDQIYSDDDFININESIKDNYWIKNPDTDNATRDVYDINLVDKKKLPNIFEMVHRYLDFIHSSQSKFLRKFTSNNFYYSLKFARYNVNDEFKYHVDELSHNDSERVVSSITYLNDDFSDGETEIMGEIIKPKKNYSLIFPSNWAFLHRGLKVKEGIKKIMVVHFYSTMDRSLL
mgnify:CR=1 FL=1|tara:strand:- start:605 stop:1147 length:543 start_codon:yes stop_codon:yes gene_type:complete